MFEILIAAAFGAFPAAAQLALPARAPVPPDSKLPYDAIVWVALRRP